jgi:hypothetical protein
MFLHVRNVFHGNMADYLSDNARTPVLSVATK